jgi:hypothetical protein
MDTHVHRVGGAQAQPGGFFNNASGLAVNNSSFTDFSNTQNVNINVIQAIVNGSAGMSFNHSLKAADI